MGYQVYTRNLQRCIHYITPAHPVIADRPGYSPGQPVKIVTGK